MRQEIVKKVDKEKKYHKIPKDHLIHILTFCDRESLLSCAVVCRFWNECTSENQVWLYEVNKYLISNYNQTIVSGIGKFKLKSLFKNSFIIMASMDKINCDIKKINEAKNKEDQLKGNEDAKLVAGAQGGALTGFLGISLLSSALIRCFQGWRARKRPGTIQNLQFRFATQNRKLTDNKTLENAIQKGILMLGKT